MNINQLDTEIFWGKNIIVTRLDYINIKSLHEGIMEKLNYKCEAIINQ